MRRHRLPGGTRRLGPVVVTGVLVAGGLLVGTSPSGGATPRSTPPPIGHFLCYPVKGGKGFAVPKGVKLVNEISPLGFEPGFANAPSLHCNPAKVIESFPNGGGTTSVPWVDPQSHLLCWGLDAPPANVDVTVANEFGTGVAMEVTSPRDLCLPSWKKRSGPPRDKVVEPANLDHFTCYAVTSPKYPTSPIEVKVKDEFSASYHVVRFGRPTAPAPDLLCVPTVKIVGGATYSTLGPDDRSLECWQVTPTPAWKQWWDQNQFGEGSLTANLPKTVLAPEQLCLPTTVTVGSASS